MLTGAAIYEQMGHNIQIIPFNKDQLNPDSYNVKLHDELLVYKNKTLDCKIDNPTEKITIPKEGYTLQPGVGYLGRTVEWTSTEQFCPYIGGRSSTGRLFLAIHVTAGQGETGFKGHWTLEMVVTQPLVVYPFMEVAQLTFWETKGEKTPYSGKYQNNKGIQSSKLFKELQ